MKYPAIALILLAIPSVAAVRSFIPEDYYSIQTLEDPQISPDGRLVAYTLRSIDARQNRPLTDIWIVPTDGSREASQVTTGGSFGSPRWSPDSRTLAYIAVRRDPQTGAATRPQVFALSMDGGEARRLTDFKNGVTAFAWSPDGAHLVCVTKTGESDSLAPGKEHSDVRNYLNANYKLDGEGFFDDRRSHLWIVDVKEGTTKQITFGSERNDSEPAWSPDGKQILYLSSRTDGSPGIDMDLCSIAAGGGASSTVSRLHVDLRSPRWSPDGKKIAYIASENETAIPKIWTSAPDGRDLKLASAMMTFATKVEWAGNGAGLYLAAGVRGEQPVFHLDSSSGTLSPLTERVDAHLFAVHEASATLICAAADERHPGDLFAINLHTHAKRQLTHLNRALLDQVTLPELEPVAYKGVDGWDIQGFLAKPQGWKEGTAYPMILMIHGGPNSM